MITTIVVLVTLLMGAVWAIYRAAEAEAELAERERLNRIIQASESRERIVPRASGLRGDHRRVS
jgi:hypothetical protein